MRPLLALSAIALLAALPATATAATPSASQCKRTQAKRQAPVVEAFDAKRGAPRVFAMQPKQELRNVVTYAAFRRKIECMIRRDVVPRMARGRPNVVVFNEDIGLMTIGTGRRAAGARATLAGGTPASCQGQASPCSALFALNTITEAYGSQLAAYQRRFGELPGLSGGFVAVTDTFARGWMTTFSDLAKRYGVYMVGSNTQTRFRESTSAKDIKTFADPDVHATSAFVATGPEVYNETFLWGPKDVRRSGATPLRNVVASNRKVPLTPLEQALSLTPGPASGAAATANLRPYRIPGTSARLGFATSLPAFILRRPPAGTDPCSDTSTYYMRCLDRLGANVVIQADANPGVWTGPDGDMIGLWQPLSWMASTWRAVGRPERLVRLQRHADAHRQPRRRRLRRPDRDHPAGHDADPDATTSATPSGSRARTGPTSWAPPATRRQFVAIAPWVGAGRPAPDLLAIGDQLLQGSGSALENDYVETAVVADLPFPVDAAPGGLPELSPRREDCARERRRRRRRPLGRPEIMREARVHMPPGGSGQIPGACWPETDRAPG